MVKCKRLFGLFGMCHVQALLLSVSYAADNLVVYALDEVILLAAERTGSVTSQADVLSLKQWHFAVIALGRLFCAIFIPKVNNKFLLLGSILTEVIFLLVVKGLHMSSYDWLASFFLGAAFIKSSIYPLTLNILSQWTLTTHMTLVYAIYEASKSILSSLALILADKLKDVGYTALDVQIYTTVVVKLAFIGAYMVLGSQDPSTSPFVSPEELADLKKDKPRRIETRWKNSAPWRGIFTTSILYGCILSDIGFLWSHDLESVEQVDLFAGYLKTHSIYKLILFYTYITGCLISAAIVDAVIRRKGHDYRNNIRKTMAAISAWGSGCSLLLVGYNLELNSVMYTVWLVFFHTFKMANFYYDSLFIVYEVSPNYFGVSYALISAVGYLTRTLRFSVESWLSKDNLEDILYFYSFLLIFCTLAMLLFGSCRLREHDSYGTVEWKDESFISFP